MVQSGKRYKATTTMTAYHHCYGPGRVYRLSVSVPKQKFWTRWTPA